jgi:hypothetical protein
MSTSVGKITCPQRITQHDNDPSFLLLELADQSRLLSEVLLQLRDPRGVCSILLLTFFELLLQIVSAHCELLTCGLPATLARYRAQMTWAHWSVDICRSVEVWVYQGIDETKNSLTVSRPYTRSLSSAKSLVKFVPVTDCPWNIVALGW